MTTRCSRRRLFLWAGLVLMTAVGVVGIARVPVTSRQGVDGVVTTYRIPLYAKALDFVTRADNYGRLAGRIVGSDPDETARVLRLFEWTRANVRDTPREFPIVDDHVWHIVMRGYGQDDQKADVFTTLAAYAGLRAYWMLLRISPREVLPLSLVEVDRRWRMFDVANGIVFRTKRGQLATPEELAATPSLVCVAAGAGRHYNNHPYAAYFANFRVPTPPDITRSELQMVWPRVRYQLKQLFNPSREGTVGVVGTSVFAALRPRCS